MKCANIFFLRGDDSLKQEEKETCVLVSIVRLHSLTAHLALTVFIISGRGEEILSNNHKMWVQLARPFILKSESLTSALCTFSYIILMTTL